MIAQRAREKPESPVRWREPAGAFCLVKAHGVILRRMRLYARHHIDIGWHDMAFALGALARPSIGKSFRGIERAWPADRRAIACLSVRTAFDALLSVLRLPGGSEIIMSAVTIAGMQDIARHHDLTIRAVDVDPDTLVPSVESVASLLSDRTRLILIAHLFGSRVDLQPFATFRSSSVLLIEDCAQSWTPMFRGSSDADVSFFSFGPIKTITALGGAVAVIRDQQLAEAFASQIEVYPQLGRWWFFKRIVKYAMLKAASQPLPYGLICRTMTLFGGDVDRAISGLTRGFGQSPSVERFRRKPPDAMIALMSRRLAAPADIAGRKSAAEDVLGVASGRHAPGGGALEPTYWVTPVFAEDPDAVRRKLMERGFDATRGTTSMRVIGDEPERTTRASGMMRRILYLPSPAHLPEAKRRELRALLGLTPPPHAPP
jgi:perosamine synthetase